MSKETARWKNTEKMFPKLLGKFGISAERISRAGNYAVSTYDCIINSFPELKSDCKFSIQGFKTSRMLEVVREKYCTLPNDIPVLFCRGYKERGGKVTIDATFFAMLLAFWMGKGTKESLWDIYTKKSSKEADDEE